MVSPLIGRSPMPDLSDDAWETANKVFEEFAGEGTHGFEMNRNEFLDAVEELFKRLSLWA
jgi:hypothetical protein